MKNQKDKVKNQHYVPRFYLRNFTCRGTIQCFDKITGKVFPTGVEAVAAENAFYDLPDYHFNTPNKSLTQPQVIEVSLSKIERRFDRAIKTLIGVCFASLPGNQIDSSNLRPTIAYFVAIQFLRTKEFRLLIEELSKKALSPHDLLGWPGVSQTATTGEPVIQPDYSAGIQAQLMFSRDTIPDFIKTFDNFIWTYEINCTGIPFYTSDNPVIEISQDGKRHGLKSPGAVYGIPINPHIMLKMFDRSSYHQLRHLDNTIIPLNDPEKVILYNFQHIQNSTRNIFSIYHDFELARNALNVIPDLADKTGKRLVKKGKKKKRQKVLILSRDGVDYYAEQ